MKETLNRILHGVTLLATVLAMTGIASADSRLSHRDSKLDRHTVQDAYDGDEHTVQDHFKIPDHELPPRGHWLFNHARGLDGTGFGAGDRPHLALGPWLEPIEVGGVGIDPAILPSALPAGELPQRALPDPSDGLPRAPIGSAQVPGPGALPLLALGTLALFGRRRRP